MSISSLDPRLRLIQDVDVKGKVILIRVDHNVVKNGKIKDPYRIDVTIKTLYDIAQRGGKPILMTHVGRPKDKKTGEIHCRDGESVFPVVEYLRDKLPIKIHLQEFPIEEGKGIVQLNGSLRDNIKRLRRGEINLIYLPNIRWFQGEQASGKLREEFVTWLSSLGDIYVNDAFSSWRAHASTYDIAMRMPSYAGFQLQKELISISKVLDPVRPFVAVIAGSKYDTKIGPLKGLYPKADRIILGGLIYNVYVAVKYGIEIEGVSDEEKKEAIELMEMDRNNGKIIELPYLVESELFNEKLDGRYRTVDIRKINKGGKLHYILDMDPGSLDGVRRTFESARTIFVNAVMGLTPTFSDGTKSLYRLIDENEDALKLFAGGDTLQELRNLCPDIYLKGMDHSDYYYFTGGGSVLTTLEKGSPYLLKPIQVLLEK
jgi:phosphoglycerate kinase